MTTTSTWWVRTAVTFAASTMVWAQGTTPKPAAHALIIVPALISFFRTHKRLVATQRLAGIVSHGARAAIGRIARIGGERLVELPRVAFDDEGLVAAIPGDEFRAGLLGELKGPNPH